MIDIGGPTMVRAAAKNFNHVGVVVDPSDYGWVVEKLDQQDGLSWQDRRHLASKAFDHVAGYDAAIANWFHREDDFPTHVHVSLERRGDPLRYGENPHQSAAAYVDALDPHHGLGAARQLHGKEMSYNNYVDTDAALGMVADFAEPCVAIIKHTNPAGWPWPTASRTPTSRPWPATRSPRSGGSSRPTAASTGTRPCASPRCSPRS